MHIIERLLQHEYLLAVYGVLLWQVEQYFSHKLPFGEFIKKALPNIGRSLIWVGIIVVFDDEILAKYNHWAAVDYKEAPAYMYTVAGFFIDFIRSQISKKLL